MALTPEIVNHSQSEYNSMMNIIKSQWISRSIPLSSPSTIAPARTKKRPSLKRGTIHLWLLSLDKPKAEILSLRSLLSPSELTRADRYHFDKHRNSYIVSQAYLRILLGDYLQKTPAEIEFSFGPRGKPYLKKTNLQFNISHSHQYALYGFTLEEELGVDIEYWRENVHADGIIKSNFSADEQKNYFQLPEDLRRTSFFQGWTCNEAFIKAVGMGLSFPLNAFSVEMDPRKAAALCSIESVIKNINYDAREWYLTMLGMPENYSAAMAINKKNLSSRIIIEKYFIKPK